MLPWRPKMMRKRKRNLVNNASNSNNGMDRTKKRRLNNKSSLLVTAKTPITKNTKPLDMAFIKVGDDYVSARLGSTCITIILSEGYVSLKECLPHTTPRTVPTKEDVAHALKIAEKASSLLQIFAKGPNTFKSTPDGRVLAGNKAFAVKQSPGYMHLVRWGPYVSAAPIRIQYAQNSDKMALYKVAVMVGKLVEGLHRMQHLHNTNLYPMPNSVYYGNKWHEWRRTSNAQPGNIRYKTKRPPATPVTLPIKLSRTGFVEAVNLELGERLGKGGFGEVFLAKVSPSHVTFMQSLAYRVPRNAEQQLKPLIGQNIAIKVQFLDTTKRLEDAIKESQIHAKLVKTGIVPKLYASGYDTQHATHVTFMEYVRGLTLESWLEEHGQVLPANMFVKIENAIIKLWMAGYAHSDFNPKNIIVRSNTDVTIIDFGWSTVLPLRLIPGSKLEAYSRKYQQQLLAHLEAKYRQLGYDRGAPDPHVLRWLYQLVPDKDRVQSLRHM